MTEEATTAPAAEPEKLTPPKNVDIQKLEVGAEIVCWCGKCKTFTLHTVKVLQPPKPPKSTCLTCRAIHQVRLEQPGKKKAAADAKDELNIAPWPELVADVNPDDATPYKISGSYDLDEFVMHKKFGLGKVVVVRGERHVRISFESELKWMVQNYQRA